MIWNENTQSYRGATSDGKTVDVTGDEWAESLRDGIQSYIDNQFPTSNGGEEFTGNVNDFREQHEALYESYENLTLIELNSPDMWAGLVGDNQNVEFVKE